MSLDADQHAMEAIVSFIIIIPQKNLIWFLKAPIICTTSQPYTSMMVVNIAALNNVMTKTLYPTTNSVAFGLRVSTKLPKYEIHLFTYIMHTQFHPWCSGIYQKLLVFMELLSMAAVMSLLTPDHML